MIFQELLKPQKISINKIAEILFYTFPLSFIIGNFMLSLHLLLFVVVGLFLTKSKHIKLRFDSSYWFLISFFIYIFLLTSTQFQSPGLLDIIPQDKIQKWTLENHPIFKSAILIRFVILVFVIDTLLFNKILNLKKFFLFSLICTSFVSFDIILQYITGFDLFGYQSFGDRNPGPFGNEWIAGSYLQKFSFLSIFGSYEIFKNKSFNKPLSIFIVTLHATAILFAGNRMPFFLFLFGCILILLLVKNLRYTMSLGLLIFVAIIFIEIKSDSRRFVDGSSKIIRTHGVLIGESIKLVKYLLNKITIENKKIEEKIESVENIKNKKIDLKYVLTTGHIAVYRSSILIWKEKPLFGFGLKSFRYKCYYDLVGNNEDPGKPNYIQCSTHPHNYYLELLCETGIIGIGLIVAFFFILLKDSFYYLKKNKLKINSEIYLIIPALITLFLEILPFRSSGSFFTNWNATFLWLIVPILISVKIKKSV